MTQADIDKLMLNAVKYPVSLRIAVLLHKSGIRYETLTKDRFVEVPIFVSVYNDLRDIQRNNWYTQAEIENCPLP